MDRRALLSRENVNELPEQYSDIPCLAYFPPLLKPLSCLPFLKCGEHVGNLVAIHQGQRAQREIGHSRRTSRPTPSVHKSAASQKFY